MPLVRTMYGHRTDTEALCQRKSARKLSRILPRLSTATAFSTTARFPALERVLLPLVRSVSFSTTTSTAEKDGSPLANIPEWSVLAARNRALELRRKVNEGVD